jgi:hypothetical protein
MPCEGFIQLQYFSLSSTPPTPRSTYIKIKI